MQSELKNPFSRIRTEQMGDSAWKYFVEPSKEYIGHKPLIFEGSRGTGKTMFFICNSWREKSEEAKANGQNIEEYIKKSSYIGFYYKVDGRFVKSLTGKKIEDDFWIGVFNTYFNIVIAKEIIIFLDLLVQEQLILPDTFENVISQISFLIGGENIRTFSELETLFDLTLSKIEKFSNNTNIPPEQHPIGLNAGTIIEKLLLTSKQNNVLKHITFHIFVDEYEVLSKEQQIEINTLLKQSNNNIVYDLGVITKGIHTSKTATGQDLRPMDDYSHFSTDRFGYYESKEYNSLLIEICKKRLKEELNKFEINYDEKYLDISFYLKNYGKTLEEKDFLDSNILDTIKQKVYNEIKRQARIYNYSEDLIGQYYNTLTNCSPLKIRIHLSLLMRKNQNIVTAKDLAQNFIDNTKRYEDWLHNMEMASLFLLCHELKIEKKYHGFQVYSALSSGVIRSFLELAEYAFDYALCNSVSPLTFENLREFTIEEQTRAVYFVSGLKIKEIESYDPPFGHRLKDFTIALGQIFKNIQLNPYATLGEVEQNHFSTTESDLLSYNEKAYDLFKLSIKNKILEDSEPTKTKSNTIIEVTDYHLNHIYCPFFSISHRRQNKISLSHVEVSKLLLGTHKELQDVVKSTSGYTDDFSPNLFTDS